MEKITMKNHFGGLERELRSFYDARRNCNFQKMQMIPAQTLELRQRINENMEAFATAHPDVRPIIMKAKLHEEIAAQCRPTIFRHSPFFFEIDVKPSESWGCAGAFHETPSSWLRARNSFLFKEIPESKWLAECPVLSGGGFDNDHHSVGYTGLLRKGINGVLAEIAERKTRTVDADQTDTLVAMDRSCNALLLVAKRFRAAAEEALGLEQDPDACKCLRLIISARVPALPPRTFYEGLAALLFIREAVASFEGIGISVLGHPDRLLIGLYRHDIAEGIISEAEARSLIARWMLPFDIKSHVDDNQWPETSSCMTLGGCDENGEPVWNELTRLFIEVHHELGLMNPKPNCRISKDSPAEYLELIARLNLGGHNNFALMNDDVLIPALVRAGKTEREARLYVNGGCQEPITEGVEHSAGAYYWINLPRLLDLCLRQADETGPEWAAKYLPRPVEETDGFEEFYTRCRDQIFNSIKTGAEWRSAAGRLQRLVNPCPMFSVSLAGCVENAADYTAGGARHNPSGICLVGIASMINSFNAIREAVFERKWISLKSLVNILDRNWENSEDFRGRMLSLPRYGHGDAASDSLAARFSREIAAFIRSLPNERGGHFQPGYFSYSSFVSMGKQVRATPDGRRSGEQLSQGCAPDQICPANSVTDTFRSISAVDLADFPGSAVLDIQLPAGSGIDAQRLAGLARSFASLGGSVVQFNCVSPETMRDAQAHPERHSGLTVRICGLSARFTALSQEVQNELINRAVRAA